MKIHSRLVVKIKRIINPKTSFFCGTRGGHTQNKFLLLLDYIPKHNIKLFAPLHFLKTQCTSLSSTGETVTRSVIAVSDVTTQRGCPWKNGDLGPNAGKQVLFNK